LKKTHEYLFISKLQQAKFPTKQEVLLLSNIGYFVKSNGLNTTYPNTTIIELEVSYVSVS